jgi:hypothetical protein
VVAVGELRATDVYPPVTGCWTAYEEMPFASVAAHETLNGIRPNSTCAPWGRLVLVV